MSDSKKEDGISRRDFLIGLKKWSKAVFAGVVAASVGSSAQAGSVWINRSGGSGGGGWANRRGGGRPY